jgi:hypothetical protein
MKFLLIALVLSMGALAAPTNKELNEFFREKTKIENPFELRDPFKSPLTKTEKAKAAQENSKYFSNGKGSYSNIAEANTSNIDVYAMKVNGVLIGKERRALVSPNPTSREIIILKEGMKIGPDGVELKAILPGGLVLVEKITNVYGQEEYLETVVPISK